MQPEFDGRTFNYPGDAGPASLASVLRWAVTRKKAKWPRHVPNPPASTVQERVEGDALRVTFINHATVLIQAGGLNLLTDPVWSRRVSPTRFAGPARHRDPGLTFDKLPPIDLVMISHCHYDHMDIRTLARLQARDQPQFIVPLGNAHHLAKGADARAIELDWWASHEMSSGARVTLVPARHWSSRTGADANQGLWGGFVVTLAGGAVYFAGDTGYGDGEHFREARRRLGPFRLSLLPIGAYEPRWFMQAQHMNPAEAVQAFGDLETAQALAIHYGTFQLTDEAIDAPPRALDEALVQADIHADRFRAMAHGIAWDVT